MVKTQQQISNKKQKKIVQAQVFFSSFVKVFFFSIKLESNYRVYCYTTCKKTTEIQFIIQKKSPLRIQLFLLLN